MLILVGKKNNIVKVLDTDDMKVESADVFKLTNLMRENNIEVVGLYPYPDALFHVNFNASRSALIKLDIPLQKYGL